MNAMQRFKERTGKTFPTHGEVIKVAVSLGYLKLGEDDRDSAVVEPDSTGSLVRPPRGQASA
jgi:hypothetical protein